MDLNLLRVVDLKQKLREKGLKTSGSKTELILRLHNSQDIGSPTKSPIASPVTSPMTIPVSSPPASMAFTPASTQSHGPENDGLINMDYDVSNEKLKSLLCKMMTAVESTLKIIDKKLEKDEIQALVASIFKETVEFYKEELDVLGKEVRRKKGEVLDEKESHHRTIQEAREEIDTLESQLQIQKSKNDGIVEDLLKSRNTVKILKLECEKIIDENEATEKEMDELRQRNEDLAEKIIIYESMLKEHIEFDSRAIIKNKDIVLMKMRQLVKANQYKITQDKGSHPVPVSTSRQMQKSLGEEIIKYRRLEDEISKEKGSSIKNNEEPRTNQSNNLNNISRVQKIQVKIIADSHGRNLGKVLSDQLNQNSSSFEVKSALHPNAKFHSIVPCIENECQGMTSNDFLIIIAGTNNITKTFKYDPYNDVQKVIEYSDKNRVNIIYVTIPYRYDNTSLNGNIYYSNYIGST
uniref:SAP domain-containing protein n=1 Tax=Cacopsylla melanoneura TaxID=428564 RepID=A0A8D8U3M5_9HEMI